MRGHARRSGAVAVQNAVRTVQENGPILGQFFTVDATGTFGSRAIAPTFPGNALPACHVAGYGNARLI